MERLENSFWAVWKPGLEWPQLFASEKGARDRAHVMAKDSVGTIVHVMKIESKGTVKYPAEPHLSGLMASAST